MFMGNKELAREQIFEIINNQMNANDPPETNLTYKRLKDLGYSDFETNQLIGQCMVAELFEVLKNHRKFDEAKYISNLKNLPKEPFH